MRPALWTVSRGFAAVFLSLSVGLRAVAKSPPVRVTLKSSWHAPPLLLEIIETCTLEDPEAFFPLISELLDPTNLPKGSSSPEATYAYALATAEESGLFTGPGARQSVDLGLALHSATPKIEAFYQHYNDLYGGEQAICNGESWVDWYGRKVCDVDTLLELTRDAIEAANITSDYTNNRPKPLTFDHVYRPLSALIRPPRTAIFYASLSSPNFWDMHLHLMSQAQRSQIEYVFRHVPPQTDASTPRNYLSGYGVALDLKKTDYLALDDRRSSSSVPVTGSENTAAIQELDGLPDVDSILAILDTFPSNPAAPEDLGTPLQAPELLELSLRTAALLTHPSSSPFILRNLRQLSQNFPLYSSLISRSRQIDIPEELRDAIDNNAAKAQPGMNIAWVNGRILKDNELTPLSLTRLLRRERAPVQALMSLSLAPSEAVSLLTHPAVAEAGSNEMISGIFDASDRAEEGRVIVWWNDLRKDSRYSRWPASINTILRPMYPGAFPTLRHNLYNAILAVDLSQSSSLTFIGGNVQAVIQRGFPYRWGVVPVVRWSEEGAKVAPGGGRADGEKMARLFWWLVDNIGRGKTMQFIVDIAQLEMPIHLLTPSVDMGFVRSKFNNLLVDERAEKPDFAPGVDFDSVAIGVPGDELDERLASARSYAERLSLDVTEAPQGHLFMNGKHFQLDDHALRLMQNEASMQLQYLQQAVFEGTITEANAGAVSEYFYDLPGTPSRRNRYVYPGADSLRIVNLVELFGSAGLDTAAQNFVYPPSEDEKQNVSLSMWLIADLDESAGMQLVKDALESIDVESRTRISFIHNPVALPTDSASERKRQSWYISHFMSTATLSKLSPTRLLKILGLSPSINVESDVNSQIPLSHGDTFEAVSGGSGLKDIETDSYAKWTSSSNAVLKELGFKPGEMGLIVNGRIVGPFGVGALIGADFKALETFEIRGRAQPVVDALQAILPSDQSRDMHSFCHLVSMSSSVISSMQIPDPSEKGLFNAPRRERARTYQMLESDYTRFTFGDNSTALLHIAVLLDPLSEQAQKWTSLFEWLVDLPDVYFELHLNPGQYTEIPLKRFYRHNFVPRLSFDENGLEVPAVVLFEGLPVEPLYTLAMDVPQPWLVRPREALYDLDNIQLSILAPEEFSRGVEAVFSLDYLVVEGHARETKSSSPPRGVQLQLTDRNGTVIDDTAIVATLGYLQLKTKPGVYKLGIRDGRGQRIFEMESVGNEGWDSPSVDEIGDEVTLTSFEGLTLYPRLRRKEGKETEDVLASSPEPFQPWEVVESVVLKIKGFFNPPGERKAVAISHKTQAEINIFTVASGLLYERFASIMILSVLRNTKSSVKFWFIENFLSPTFLEFIPHFAEAYGFQYELVTYKWPSFIRQQKEKQRIIWAYKILFLDVLFPMDLKKVIFVDADQIVRADLKELVDLDLHGAPYGYVPMGDDNTDMEGFRFWKTGYWKEFLQGLPYHISALYVIDLVRFRQMAAGDILRQQYQHLSADPGSLANLDQDLPNNIQRDVPIYSLPEDWLWCETWCSKDRLHRAKTIDLCQNPLTKEPKLARARQIPEWEEYDGEIARFARRLAEAGKIRSGAAAADANVLASAGAGGAAASAALADDHGGEDFEKRERAEDEKRRDEL